MTGRFVVVGVLGALAAALVVGAAWAVADPHTGAVSAGAGVAAMLAIAIGGAALAAAKASGKPAAAIRHPVRAEMLVAADVAPAGDPVPTDAPPLEGLPPPPRPATPESGGVNGAPAGYTGAMHRDATADAQGRDFRGGHPAWPGVGAALRQAMRRLGTARVVTVRPLRRTLRSQPSERAPEWHAVAQQIHSEVGGEWGVQRHLAERITARRRSAARRLAAGWRPVQVVAWSLSGVPLAVGTVAALTDPAYVVRLTAHWSLPVAAAVLTAGGWWWLHQLARPPFAVRPSERRAYAGRRGAAARLEVVLERGALYAAADVPVAQALRHAARVDPGGPGQLLVRWFENHAADVLTVATTAPPVDRCANALTHWLEEGAPPEEALAAGAVRARLLEAWLTWPGLPRALLRMATPLLVCVVPAALLLAWL